MRQLTEKFNRNECIENISRILDCKLENLPHGDTINDFLEKLDPVELEEIIPKLVNHLIRMKSFRTCLISSEQQGNKGKFCSLQRIV